MSRRILFLDRDGTLIQEPEDGRVDSLEKLALVDGVIPALLRCRDAGYEFVIVSNQDGLGEADFSQAAFDVADRHMRALFGSQGVQFSEVLYCPHRPEAQCSCRKPAVGLLRAYLVNGAMDRSHSAVIGDRESDLELAANMGLAAYKLGGQDGMSWSEIAHRLIDRPRTARVARKTRETDIVVSLDLDRERDAQIHTGLGFFDHMLEQLGKHGGFELSIECRGDLDVDEHHTIEDVALTLGQAIKEALGDKRGLHRYGFVLPMDEATAEVAVDLGGRPYLVFEGDFPRDNVGGLPTELVAHFFRSLCDTLGASLQIRVRGDNAHHMIEACFKGVARSLRQAFARSGDVLPTTKGQL
jgi:imidazoleglycerol-phosphate dehydratase/histidinol-phosphatase